MKSMLRLSLFIFIAASFSACVKSVDIVVTPPPVSPIVGSWILNDASVSSGGHWISFNSGINGVFYFYNSGNAEYDDATAMQGVWNINSINSNYYDEYGNYYAGAHKSFQVNVSDNSGGSLDLYFDYITFVSSNEFIATYDDGKNVERYTFTKY